MLESSKTNVLIVGSGGREHAIARKIVQSKRVAKVYVAPGNGGTCVQNVPIKATNIGGLREFATKENCFTIVGPEIPLSLGIVDYFLESELPIFGPTKEQAKLETSKSYAKNFMKQNAIPTARYETFTDAERAIDFAHKLDGEVAVKADGLAAGKGVFVCSSTDQAEEAIRSILEKRMFGDSGSSVVVEEKLDGREISLMALCNGTSAVSLGTATDHKRLLDGDKGPNTGGMGAYSPSLDFDSEKVDEVMSAVMLPTVRSTLFRGFLYAGLMITKDKINVLEFNVRLGDPETQSILPRLESDLFELVLQASQNEKGVANALPTWSNLFCCTVAMCARGYPSDPKLGDEIKGLDKIRDRAERTFIFHSGTKKQEDGKLLTSGGRVLYVSSLGKTLKEASDSAYESVDSISWEGEYHRRDIGRSRNHVVALNSTSR